MIDVATSFAQAGFHVFTFDYRHLGERWGQSRQLVSIAGQQENFLSAIHFIKELPDVNGKRVAIWGSSLKGIGLWHAVLAKAG